MGLSAVNQNWGFGFPFRLLKKMGKNTEFCIGERERGGASFTCSRFLVKGCMNYEKRE